MPYPAGLTLVTVTGRVPTATSGQASFTRAYTLVGAADNSMVPPETTYAALNASGEFTIVLPATNDPGWVPVNTPYSVEILSSAGIIRGTVLLDYQTTTVELADLIQIDGTVLAGVTYATLAQLTDHASDTTGVHGIANTANLIIEGDARLTNARTPTAHAASHADGGADDLSATYLPLATGGVVSGNVTVQDAGATKSYGFRTSGASLDLEGAGADLFLSVWSGAGATGTQRNYARLESGAALAHLLGRHLFASGAFDGSGVADLDPSTGVAAIGAKNSLTNVRFAGFKATAGAPSTGTWTAGDVVLDSTGAWHLCTAGGTPGTWTASAGGGSTLVVKRAVVSSGNITPQNTAGAWAALTGGPTLVIPAAVGDYLAVEIMSLIITKDAGTFYDLAVSNAGLVRFGSSGTDTPAAEGDGSLYHDTNFPRAGTVFDFVAEAGDINSGNVTVCFAVKSGGAGTLHAGFYPLRWRILNHGAATVS